jgi:hypothetical protein
MTLTASALMLCVVMQAAPAPRVLNSDEVIAAIVKAAGQPAPSVARVSGAAEPSAQPSAKQVSAPSASGASPANVDRASFPELFAFAADLVSFNGGATTLSLNPFGLVAAAKPEVLDKQSEYQKYNGLRRFGAAFTLGGKGEKFDRDGDGKDDDPLTAQNLDDIVTYEVKYRVWGSRDRRDQENWKRYFAVTSDSFEKVDAAIRALVTLSLKDVVLENNVPIGVSASGFEARLAGAEGQPLVSTLREAYAALKRDIKAANTVTDKRLIWTAAIAGKHQKEQFGRDNWKLGLRGEGATGRVDHTINIDWSQVDALTGDDPTVFKGGYKLACKILQNTWLTKDGATVSFDGVFEHYDHVPDATHSTVAKAALKLEIPLSKSATVPFSATYVNHRDLLTGQQGWIGHVGVTWDLSPLKALVSGATKD